MNVHAVHVSVQPVLDGVQPVHRIAFRLGTGECLEQTAPKPVGFFL